MGLKSTSKVMDTSLKVDDGREERREHALLNVIDNRSSVPLAVKLKMDDNEKWAVRVVLKIEVFALDVMKSTKLPTLSTF